MTETLAPEAEALGVAGLNLTARGIRALPVLVPVLVPMLVFAGALLGHVLLAPGDGSLYYFPMHVLTSDAWRSLHVPAWNPFAFSGTPLLATSQSGAFYPPNALFVVLPDLYANNAVVVLNLVIAARPFIGPCKHEQAGASGRKGGPNLPFQNFGLAIQSVPAAVEPNLGHQ